MVDCCHRGRRGTVTPVAADFAGNPARPQVDTPKGPVRQVILKSCAPCHGIDEFA